MIASLTTFPKNLNAVSVVGVPLPSIDQIVHTLRGAIAEVGEKQLVETFFKCKMTNINETALQGQNEYTFLRWSEFLEFVCRLAYVKFEKTPQHETSRLVTKLGPTLD